MTRIRAVIAAAALASAAALSACSSPGPGSSPAPDSSRRPIEALRTWDNLGSREVSGPVRYPMAPPAGGDHSAEWVPCDGRVYSTLLPNEQAVHSLANGAVWITYKPGVSSAEIDTLSSLVSGYDHRFMSPYSGQAANITLTAWGVQLEVLDTKDPRVEQFLDRYGDGSRAVNKGASCAAAPVPAK